MVFFSNVQNAPSDPILGLNETYSADSRTNKVNLGIGVYCDENGKIPLFDAVKQAEQHLAQNLGSKAYLPIDGLDGFNRATCDLLFGADSVLREQGRVRCLQTIGASGALRVGSALLRCFLPEAQVYVSAPTWENHCAIFEASGFQIASYRYYDQTTHGVDFTGMIEDLSNARRGSVLLLHACCHNPTGADLTHLQWKALAELIKEKQLFPFLDLAYQGFDKDPDMDAFAVRMLAEAGVDTYFVANSYSKSFALYGERVGGLSIVTPAPAQTAAVVSHAKRIIRSMYSNPPVHGARIVSHILHSRELNALWRKELADICARMHNLRKMLCDSLEKLQCTQYAFMQNQTGMFAYSSLSKEQVQHLRTQYAIYVIDNGRVCVAGLNQKNLSYVAQAIASMHSA